MIGQSTKKKHVLINLHSFIEPRPNNRENISTLKCTSAEVSYRSQIFGHWKNCILSGSLNSVVLSGKVAPEMSNGIDPDQPANKSSLSWVTPFFFFLSDMHIRALGDHSDSFNLMR